MSHDWTAFKLRIDIQDVSVKDVYNCWSTQQGLEDWFLRTAEFRGVNGNFRHSGEQIMKGDEYKWHWFGWGDDTVETGEVLNANGSDQISFSFEGCIVHVNIYIEERSIICELVQSKISTDEKSKISTYLGCRSGWSFFMTNLKSILEGGIDLRNKNDKLSNLINA